MTSLVVTAAAPDPVTIAVIRGLAAAATHWGERARGLGMGKTAAARPAETILVETAAMAEVLQDEMGWGVIVA